MNTPRSSGPRSRRAKATPELSLLIGRWRKQSGGACAAQYPADLELREGGHYRGASDPPGEYTLWDVGTWSIEGPDEVAISTAYDALIRYRYTLSDGALAFTDPEGCAFSYTRAE